MYNRRKIIIKNGVLITMILLLAILATHNIYHKFKNERNVDYSSTSLDIIFHEKTGNKIALERVTPVTDSVGLSSKAYTFTIKNNLTEKAHFKIVLKEDTEFIMDDECAEYQIPKNIIKVALKEEGKDDEIYILDELNSGLLKEKTIRPLAEKNFTVRVWTANNTLPNGTLLHYHGIIDIEEKNE